MPEIFFHADLDGRLADPDCDELGKDTLTSGLSVTRPSYPGLLSAIAAARTTAAERDQPRPIVLLGGNLATPDPLGRALLERESQGASRLARLFARGGYDAVALGHHDLSLPPTRLQDLVGALRAHGMPVVISNLSCDSARVSLCQSTRRYLLVHRGPLTIAVLATISPSVLTGVAPAARAGLGLGDPLAAIKEMARQARGAGASAVIVITQGPRGQNGLTEIDALQRGLVRLPPLGGATAGTTKQHAPDVTLGEAAVILAGGLWDEETGSPLRVLKRDGAPTVVGSGNGASSLTRVTWPTDADADADAGDALPVSVPPRTPDPEAEALVAREVASYCKRFDVPIASVPVRSKLSREAFTTYALEIMRRRAGAEIALINRAAVKRTPFPVAGAMTAGDLERALPYGSVMGVVSLSGASVEQLLGPALANPKLVAIGLTRAKEGGLQINGRPLDKARQYRLATIAFVAAGGDAILPPNSLSWHALEGNPELKETIAAFLRTETAARDGDASVDAATDFGPSLNVRPLLIGITDVGVDFTDTRISNGSGYGDAQLVRATQQVLKGEATSLLQLRQPRHEADARLNLRYGWTRSQPPNAARTSGETTDLVTFTTVYSYRGFRARPERARPAIPDPYLRVGLESEFTRPPVSATQARAFHHFELTNTAGALFTVTPAFRVRGGAGLRKELLTASAPLGRWRPLFEVGATLSPIALASFGPLAIRFEGLVDYNFVDPTGVREHQLRLNSKLSIPLVPLLYVTAGVDMFAVQRERQGWAASYDTTIGLRVHFDAAHQWM